MYIRREYLLSVGLLKFSCTIHKITNKNNFAFNMVRAIEYKWKQMFEQFPYAFLYIPPQDIALSVPR